MQAKLKQLTTRNLELETIDDELGLRVQTLEQEAFTVRNMQMQKTDQMKAYILQKNTENEELRSCVEKHEHEIFFSQ